VQAATQIQQDPDTTAAILQNPLFAQMGQALMNNPAMMEHMQRLMGDASAAALVHGSPPSGGAAMASEDEDRMMEEAMRRSMLDLEPAIESKPDDRQL
jgi:hypothetical protein